MTAPVRRRKKSADDELPADLLAWFRGEQRERAGPPWSALIFPDCELLRERWQAFAAANPGARPPAGFERLCEPEPPLSPHRRQIRSQARAAASRRSTR